MSCSIDRPPLHPQAGDDGIGVQLPASSECGGCEEITGTAEWAVVAARLALLSEDGLCRVLRVPEGEWTARRFYEECGGVWGASFFDELCLRFGVGATVAAMHVACADLLEAIWG